MDAAGARLPVSYFPLQVLIHLVGEWPGLGWAGGGCCVPTPPHLIEVKKAHESGSAQDLPQFFPRFAFSLPCRPSQLCIWEGILQSLSSTIYRCVTWLVCILSSPPRLISVAYSGAAANPVSQSVRPGDEYRHGRRSGVSGLSHLPIANCLPLGLPPCEWTCDTMR